MLSLRFNLRSRKLWVGKSDNILERQSLVFIQYSDKYSGITKKTERMLGLPWGWLWSLQENSWYPKEPLGRISEGYQSFSKATESVQVKSRHCLPVMVTKFKLSEATSVSPFMALHSIWRLVFFFVTFWISTMDVYMLVGIYYVFLESVGINYSMIIQ